MQGKISMDLSFCQSETGFSLDELVTKLADVYERKAFAELLKMILQMVQEILIHRLLHGRLDTLKCCDRGHFRLNGSFERRIRTSLGEFKMPKRQARRITVVRFRSWRVMGNCRSRFIPRMVGCCARIAMK